MVDWTAAYREEIDADGYVPFNEDRRLGQNQYAARHVRGDHGSANLGEGLRFRLGAYERHGDYHDIRIHIDDLAEFHERVLRHQTS